MSFVVRSIEAIGNACFLTASFSIIAQEFPDRVSTMFACLETCFGIGLIAGPSVGEKFNSFQSQMFKPCLFNCKILNSIATDVVNLQQTENVNHE